jgi:hypothetical protein
MSAMHDAVFEPRAISERAAVILDETGGNLWRILERLAAAEGRSVVTVRLPPSLHNLLHVRSQAEDLNLNELCQSRLAVGLQPELVVRLAEIELAAEAAAAMR